MTLILDDPRGMDQAGFGPEGLGHAPGQLGPVGLGLQLAQSAEELDHPYVRQIHGRPVR